METFTLKQAAKFLNMHWQTLREKAKSGQIPGAKIGKQWVFIRDDLVSYIRSQYACQRSSDLVNPQHIRDSIFFYATFSTTHKTHFN